MARRGPARARPGDSVHIDKDVVHGSYNDFDEPAKLQVVLAPAHGEGGYVAVDVSTEAPWATLRSCGLDLERPERDSALGDCSAI